MKYLHYYLFRSRRDYRDYRAGAAVGSGSGGRGGYSPPPGRGGGDGPPVKRMRGDWDDARPRYGNNHKNKGTICTTILFEYSMHFNIGEIIRKILDLSV